MSEGIEISASGPVDGMGEKHPEGSYVQITMRSAEVHHNFRISRGMADGLVAELQAALGISPPHDVLMALMRGEAVLKRQWVVSPHAPEPTA